MEGSVGVGWCGELVDVTGVIDGNEVGGVGSTGIVGWLFVMFGW